MKRHRLGLLAAGGLCALSACDPAGAPLPPAGPVEEGSPAPPPASEAPAAAPAPLTDAERIDQGLARLDALEVLDTGALFETRTEHQWVPYGGLWNSHAVEMEEVDIANRVQDLAARAEAAVAAVEGPDAEPAFDAEALCWALGDGAGAHCLTIEPYEADVAALNALEIVEVAGILRDRPAQDGMCYTSWYTVTEADCGRAKRLRAIVEATRDLPAATPPLDSPED
jgi:hypothetical protein